MPADSHARLVRASMETAWTPVLYHGQAPCDARFPGFSGYRVCTVDTTVPGKFADSIGAVKVMPEDQVTKPGRQSSSRSGTIPV